MYKRVEMYIGFKCNNNCIFCVEYFRRKKYQSLNLLSSDQEIIKTLSDYKQKGYNHVNILGGEPFLERNFKVVLKLAKEMGFLIAVTTNGSILAQKNIAKESLPLIDDLVLSIHGYDQKSITKQSNSPSLCRNLLSAYKNIKQFFKGRILKSNTVINKLNYENLLAVVKFIAKGGIKEMSLTSMSLDKRNQDYAVEFSKLVSILEIVANYCEQKGIKLRISDIPLCFLGKYYFLANHLFFDQRSKYDVDGKIVVMDRPKIKSEKCLNCVYKDICQGLDQEYYKIYGDKEINPILS